MPYTISNHRFILKQFYVKAIDTYDGWIVPFIFHISKYEMQYLS